MTTDYIQRNEAGRRLRLSLLPKALRKSRGAAAPCKGGLELTRQESFVNGAHDIFDLLSRNHQEKERLRHTVDQAVTVLGKARLIIELAEQKLARQDTHIRNLEKNAKNDLLTGLLNRQGFLEVFSKELNRSKRGLAEGGLLILIEVENLKNINYDYGSKAGDTCLKLVAQVLKNEIRAMDAGAFIGGDEFVLLFPNAEKEQSLERAQKLALRLNNLSFIWQSKEICISSSLGLKSYGPEDSADDIFCQADKDLHEKKESARAYK